MVNNTTAFQMILGTSFAVTGGVVGYPAATQTALVCSQGTFVANGASAVTVNDAAITTTSIIDISLNTVGGTVGAIPATKTIAAGTMTVAGTAADTSTYNYCITNLIQVPATLKV